MVRRRSIATSATSTPHLVEFTSRKVDGSLVPFVGAAPDTVEALSAWISRYLTLAVVGVRSEEVADKIALHLERFATFFKEAYGHERIRNVLKRDVLAWQRSLSDQGLAPATVNNHLASLSGFTTWVHAQAPHLFAVGDPTKGISELGLPPLEPRTLSPEQVRSLKSVCDRLERFHQLRGRRWTKSPEQLRVRSTGRPLRDRAIIYVLLSTGLRREELVNVDLDQVSPNTPAELRRARQGRITRVQGKGKTERTVFLSADARVALADYLEQERPRDANEEATALLLSAVSLPARNADGRLSPRAINLLLEQIGRWHDAEVPDARRRTSPLRPHDLRHTFAFHLAQVTGADAYELERRLGHRSQRYIQRYTNPPEAVAASYIEEF
jgi:site-specific recombinase XerD